MRTPSFHRLSTNFWYIFCGFGILGANAFAVRPHTYTSVLYQTNYNLSPARILPATRRLAATLDDASEFLPNAVVPWIVLAAVVLGVTANGWINQLLSGKSKQSGLGAFLRDGSGYNRSGFAMRDDSDRAVQSDPLPWLKLPRLDFVDVAGQENEEVINTAETAALEQLRQDMNQAINSGNMRQAEKLRNELNKRMLAAGVEYNTDVY